MNKPTEDDEAAIDATKAPLMDHLIELRRRLIYSIIAFVVCFGICFYFAQPIYAFLSAPLTSSGTWNSAHFKNAEYDALVKGYIGSLDLESQRAAAGKIW